jgi:N-acetylmuramoyl-L-alanine amidase
MNGNSARAAWAGTEEIGRQLSENKKYPEVKGNIHFRYQLIARDRAIAAAVKAIYGAVPVLASADIDIVMPAPKAGVLTVGRPHRDVAFSGKNYYISGASDPGQKLTVNGTEITGRTAKGYFSYYATLKSGDNVFTFAQGNTRITRTITVPPAPVAEGPKRMDAAVIEPGVFPDVFDEIAPPGSTVTLACVAPIGAEVTVRVGGKTLTMKPDTARRPSGGGYYATTYKAAYTMPDVSSSSAPFLTVGTPVYTMTMDGAAMSRAANSSLKVSTGTSRLQAAVVNEFAFVYPSATTSGGPAGELYQGQTDTVTAQQNGTWVRLGCGLWVLRSDVRLSVNEARLRGNVTGADYQTGDKWDTLTIFTDRQTAALAGWDGGNLTFTVHSASAAPAVTPPSGALIGKVNASLSGGKAVYTLTPAPGMVIDGYHIEPVRNGIRLHIKRRPAAKPGGRPLEGISIVIDAGHGGSDAGAFSPLGNDTAEKTINLYAALKLRKVLADMGAEVRLTRSSDVDVTLRDRLHVSRKARPDLFLSLHCNSMGEETNSDSIQGIVVLYREAAARDFSEHIYDYLRSALGVSGRGCRAQNLYVCRGSWTPSVLIEMGFINNPHDYEWLTDNNEQNRLILALADGIADYFR